jgi:hypothetical protein
MISVRGVRCEPLLLNISDRNGAIRKTQIPYVASLTFEAALDERLDGVFVDLFLPGRGVVHEVVCERFVRPDPCLRGILNVNDAAKTK